MASQIQIRRDTAANWTSANPTLAEGELGLETDTRKLKIGDGITAWNDLEYYSTTEGLMGTAWDDSFTYAEDDIIGYGGSIYISLQDSNLNKQPDTATTYWEVFTGGGGGLRRSETLYAPSYISYLAFAPQGSLETDAVWTITKRVGSADGTIISNVQYLLKKWSERNLL